MKKEFALLEEDIWELSLENGKLIPDLLSKDEIEHLLLKVDPLKTTLYWDDINYFYQLTQVQNIPGLRHVTGIVHVILKIPNVKNYDITNVFTVYPLPRFIKENISIRAKVPKHAIIHPYRKKFGSIPEDCEEVNHFYWKCKYFQYTRESSTKDLCLDATICPVIVEENRENFEVNVIGENIFFSYSPLKEKMCELFLTSVYFFGTKQEEIATYPQYNGLRIFDIRMVKAIECPGRYMKFAYINQIVKKVTFQIGTENIEKDFNGRINAIQNHYQEDMTKDKLDSILQKGFQNLEKELEYSKGLPGKIKRIKMQFENDDWITMLIIAIIIFITIFILIFLIYLFCLCKNRKKLRHAYKNYRR